MKNIITKKNTFEFAQMVLGNAICAFSVTCFALPYNMVVSGVSGIGRIANILTGVSVSAAVAVINTALFLIGAAVLGKHQKLQQGEARSDGPVAANTLR